MNDNNVIDFKTGKPMAQETQEPDVEQMDLQQLEQYLDELYKLRDDMDANEPADLESEAHEDWEDEHEELEDLIDDVLDRLDDLRGA